MSGDGAKGYCFMCNNRTESECLDNLLLGSASGDLVKMEKHINSNTLLYLFNFDSLRLIGTFVSNGAPGMSLVPGAFNGKFSAHIKVTPMLARTVKWAVLKRRISSGSKTQSEVLQLQETLASGTDHSLDEKLETIPNLNLPSQHKGGGKGGKGYGRNMPSGYSSSLGPSGGDISLNQMFSTPMSLVVPGSVPSHYVEYVSTGSQGYWDEYAGGPYDSSASLGYGGGSAYELYDTYDTWQGHPGAPGGYTAYGYGDMGHGTGYHSINSYGDGYGHTGGGPHGDYHVNGGYGLDSGHRLCYSTGPMRQSAGYNYSSGRTGHWHHPYARYTH